MPPRCADALDVLRARRRRVRERYGAARLNGCRAADVRSVLLIDAASRSGSSFLHHLLSLHPDVVSLHGESVALEKLHGIGWAESAADSDALPEGAVGPERLAALAEDLLLDAGALVEPGGGAARDEFLHDCVQRLLLQYPEAGADPEALRAACARALARVPAGRERWLEVLREVRALVPAAEPRRYDLRGSDPAADFPESDNATPPPFDAVCVEEPPFVVPRPRRLPPPDVLATKTLLLKSTSNAYRLWLVKRLFPSARLRVLALTRNPAAAVSGLMDGWLSDGFYSRDVARAGPLAIRGYTREDRPWTRRWWNFDLPPGWAGYRAESLERVCAHQWASANEHILADMKSGAIGESLLLRYESFLEPAALSAELSRVLDFAGLSGPLPAAAPERVMSVTPPAPQKWRKRRDALAPVIAEPRVRELAAALGYDPRRWEEWA